MRLLGSPKGKAPRPWDHILHNPYTDQKKPDIVEREGQLLKRIGLRDWMILGLIGVAGLLAWQSRVLAGKIQPEIRVWVVEVAETGQIRSVGLLPQKSYDAPTNNTLIYVIRMWLWYVRTVGDSKVLLGQNWEMAKAFTDTPVQAWLHEQIRERYEQQFLRRQTVQITKPVILPVSNKQREFRAEWEELTISQGGDIIRRARWQATFVLRVAPPPKIQEQQDWKNDLGIVVHEVHWLELSTKGPQS
jgi:type IV secretory pathway TrbF-like protein